MLQAGGVRSPEAFLRRAARHNALDALGKRDGYRAAGPRPAAVEFDPDRHADAADDDLLAGLPDADRAAAMREVLEALETLPALERQALTLRHVDGLNPATCRLLLGVSERQWKRLQPRALARLRRTLAQTDRGPECRQARVLVRRGLLPGAAAIRRDAHLENCLPCRAFAHDWRHGGLPVPRRLGPA